uniref:Secreted protein n=1 Tax=Macrostomum lignano TaxID=282301 RepID=A0A1I8FET6_9PLAT
KETRATTTGRRLLRSHRRVRACPSRWPCCCPGPCCLTSSMIFYCRTGERREATFYSLYVFFTKVRLRAAAIALSQLVLSFSGYDSNSCEQPYSVAWQLALLSRGPGRLSCASAWPVLLMHFYPIDKPYAGGAQRPAVWRSSTAQRINISQKGPLIGDRQDSVPYSRPARIICREQIPNFQK